MGDEQSTSALQAAIESALRDSEPERAIEPLRQVLGRGAENVLFLDAWLKLVFCLCVTGKAGEAQRVVDELGEQVQALSARHFDAGHAMIGATVTGEATDLRSAAERFSQGFRDYAKTEYPAMFATVERLGTGADTPAHDYRVTSYGLWISGLNEMAAGGFQEGLTLLLGSIEGYRLGRMLGDVYWSWSDAVLCKLFMDDLKGAEDLYKQYAASASAAQSRFLEVAHCYLQAYRATNEGFVTKAHYLIAQNWDAFKFSQYPRILRSFSSKLRATHDAAAKPAAGETQEVTDAVETTHERDSPAYMALLARPAREEDEEIRKLVMIASNVNLGATRAVPAQVRFMVRLSRDTLLGRVPWDQGLLYLATECHAKRGGQPRIVGSCKLQFPLHAKWRIETRTRVAQKKHRSECGVLVFDSSRHDGLEMAGNAVLPEARGLGVGGFHVAARLLFISMFDIPVTHLFANLLTTDVQGAYPFYESVVRPLLGGIDYDHADELRYEDSDLVTQLLGSTWDRQPPVQFPVHVLPEEVRDHLGEVRTITRRAQYSLEKYGFRRAPTLDLLDGGQYFELPVEELRRRPIFRELYPVASKREAMSDDYVTFAPMARSQEEFVCVRCRGRIDETDLSISIPSYVFRLLSLRKGDAVRSISPPKSSG